MSNKESLVIILDIRENVRKEFKQKSVKCVAEILKEKICAAKKDYITFVLLGSNLTDNEVNRDVDVNGYMNIVQYPCMQLATWQLLINFFKFVNEPNCTNGDWLDALVVALSIQKEAQINLKVQKQRIILFQDFSVASETSFDMFNEITKNLLEHEIQLIAVSSDIAYVDNPEDMTKTQAIFQHSENLSQSQQKIKDEQYALLLVSYCNANLCNFSEIYHCAFKLTNKRPWCWNSKLHIGSTISIAISGIIAIKNESNIKLKRCWAENDEVMTRDKHYYVRGEEIQPLPEELLDGYMLGGTPIEYNKELHELEPKLPPGLKFIGFTKAASIPTEYFCGESLYWIVHQKGLKASAKKLESLVKALHNTKMAVLCWKVFSVKFSNPKLVVLLPNELKVGQPASLSMVELAYHAQHHFWDFPALCTKKTECSKEQVDAIDDLMDAMNLNRFSEKSEPRKTRTKTLLPFDALPHIYEQNVMDILERKIIYNAGETDEQFQKMLLDKNFVDVYWKLPEEIEEKAKRAAKQVKKVFPLQRVAPVIKPKIGATLASQKSEPNWQQELPNTPLDFDSIRAESMAEDFQALLDQRVAPIRNTTERDVKFNEYVVQLRDLIWQQLFDSSKPPNHKPLAQALKSYRVNMEIYDAFEDYNKWIRELKAKIIERKEPYLIEFFQKVIVAGELGPCCVGDPLLDEDIACEEYYTI